MLSLNLGYIYSEGKGVPRNNAQAAIWYRKAAEHGDDLAAATLGSMYLWGKGVPENYAEAMKWSLKAAKQGNAFGQYSLGDIYMRGLGVPQNYILSGIPQMNSRTGVNIRAFPIFLQDRRAVRTGAVTSVTWTAVEGADLAIVPGIRTYSSRRLHLSAWLSNVSCWRWSWLRP